jgi:hypothetical protein
MKEFDEEYAKRVREGCFKAILEASIRDGKLQLSEREIYDGVMSAIAMIHSSQDKAPTPETTAQVSEAIARHFRERVEELKAVKEQLHPASPDTSTSGNIH